MEALTDKIGNHKETEAELKVAGLAAKGKDGKGRSNLPMSAERTSNLLGGRKDLPFVKCVRPMMTHRPSVPIMSIISCEKI